MATPDFDPIQSALLDEVYLGLTASQELSSILVYKGARILKQLLGTTRYSQDIDATLSRRFVAAHPTIPQQQDRLTNLIAAATHAHFEESNPVRYELLRVDLKLRPGRDVPDNWRMFAAFIHVRDALAANSRDLVAQVDISLAENLSESAIDHLTVDNHVIYAYRLERIAGEKLRAFLSCLPTYRKKIGQRSMDRRAKDLYDLAKILARRPIRDMEFWQQAGREFVLACEFRRIDCSGLDSFVEDWAVTETEYHLDERLRDTPISQAKYALQVIVAFLQEQHFLPLEFPLTSKPISAANDR